MKKILTSLGTALVLVGLGVGVASADPINTNSRYFSANCDGEILNFVTNNGASAHVIGNSRVATLQGATQDGVWTLPITNGQSKADLVECVYTQLFNGHQFVIYVNLSKS